MYIYEYKRNSNPVCNANLLEVLNTPEAFNMPESVNIKIGDTINIDYFYEVLRGEFLVGYLWFTREYDKHIGNEIEICLGKVSTNVEDKKFLRNILYDLSYFIEELPKEWMKKESNSKWVIMIKPNNPLKDYISKTIIQNGFTCFQESMPSFEDVSYAYSKSI